MAKKNNVFFLFIFFHNFHPAKSGTTKIIRMGRVRYHNEAFSVFVIRTTLKKLSIIHFRSEEN